MDACVPPLSQPRKNSDQTEQQEATMIKTADPWVRPGAGPQPPASSLRSDTRLEGKTSVVEPPAVIPPDSLHAQRFAAYWFS